MNTAFIPKLYRRTTQIPKIFCVPLRTKLSCKVSFYEVNDFLASPVAVWKTACFYGVKPCGVLSLVVAILRTLHAFCVCMCVYVRVCACHSLHCRNEIVTLTFTRLIVSLCLLISALSGLERHQDKFLYTVKYH